MLINKERFFQYRELTINYVNSADNEIDPLMYPIIKRIAKSELITTLNCCSGHFTEGYTDLGIKFMHYNQEGSNLINSIYDHIVMYMVDHGLCSKYDVPYLHKRLVPPLYRFGVHATDADGWILMSAIDHRIFTSAGEAEFIAAQKMVLDAIDSALTKVGL